MSRSRELHQHVRARIELALGGRSWRWLSTAAAIPYSTLAEQAAKPKFSLDVLVAVAEVLERDIAYFLPHASLAEVRRTASDDALDRIRRILAELP